MQLAQSSCGHLFCNSCIRRAVALRKECPKCRRKLTLENIHRIYG